MPIYEYLCTDCDHRFEKLVRRWGEAVCCPTCRGGSVDKQLSTFAVASSSGVSAVSEGCGRGDGGCGSAACGNGVCQYPS